MTYHDNSYQSWVWDNAHNPASRTTVAGGNEIQRFEYEQPQPENGYELG
jgi:hypothetical protein